MIRKLRLIFKHSTIKSISLALKFFHYYVYYFKFQITSHRIKAYFDCKNNFIERLFVKVEYD